MFSLQIRMALVFSVRGRTMSLLRLPVVLVRSSHRIMYVFGLSGVMILVFSLHGKDRA